MEKISIIVPIYNAASYLERLLQSICNQTYQNLQIILVDDGSLDDSLVCCEEWAKKEPRILVLHQENAGVSAARNTGLKAATGEYVMFVDADDWIASDMIQTLYDLAKQYQADVSTCNYIEIPEGSEALALEQEKLEQKIESKIHVATEKVEAGLQLLLPWSVFCKLYKKSLLEKICFQPYKIAEDLLFNTEIICDTTFARIVSIERKMYYYFIHKNSAIRQGYQRKYLDGVKVEEQCYDRLIKLSPKFGDINIVGCSVSMMFERMAELSWKERRAVIEDFRWCKKSAKKYKQALLNTTNRHRKISGALKVYIPDLYLWSLVIRKRR